MLVVGKCEEVERLVEVKPDGVGRTVAAEVEILAHLWFLLQLKKKVGLMVAEVILRMEVFLHLLILGAVEPLLRVKVVL